MGKMKRIVRRLVYLGLGLLPLLAIACGKATRSGAGADGESSGGNTTQSGGSAGMGGSSIVDGGATSSSAGGAGGSADGTSSSSGGAPATLSTDLEGSPIYTRVQRLTNSQWQHSVSDILRLDDAPNLARDFQSPVQGLTDFTNNERVLSVGEREFTDYETAAEAAAALATGTPEALQALYAGTDPEGFVSTLGLRAFRRPLSQAEVDQYLELFELGESLYGEGFANGAALVIRGMLQSPHFLYRTELGEAGQPLSGYERAAKASLWLLDTTPDDELLDAAARGELDSVETLETAAAEMLETDAATAVMRDFHWQLYTLSRLTDIVKNDIAEFTPTLQQELVDGSAAFFDSVFERDEGLTEILTSTRAYAGPELAPIYGVEVAGDALEEVDLGPERTGYFMQAPFLMLHANNAEPNSVYRGVRLSRDVLCANLLPPPDTHAPSIPAPQPGQTNRERIESITNPCGTACHQFLDPLGFAFEGFDGMAQALDTDNGRPIDASGTYPFSSGVEAFSDARELMQLFADSDEASLCYSKKVTGYGLGRDVVESDLPLLEELSVVSRTDSLKQVTLALVRNPAFNVRQEAP